MGGACCDSQSDMRPGQAPSGGLDKNSIGKKVKVEYFEGFFGRPAPIVFLLEHKGAAYEYATVSQEAWPARKASGGAGEFGGLPIVTRGGQEQQQTNAVLRSLGIQHGYYNPKDWKNAGIIDMIVDTQAEFFNKASGIIVFTPDDEKAAAIEQCRDGLLTKLLGLVEAQLQRNPGTKFIVGDKITIADCAMAQCLFNFVLNEQGPMKAAFSPILTLFPSVQDYIKRVEPEFAPYLNKREPRPF